MTHTIIYRHRKERRAKCTLTPFEKDPTFQFFTYPKEQIQDTSCLYLSLEGKELQFSDRNRPLLLLDSTWKKLEKMAKLLPSLETRTLPAGFQTAYPRRQDDCQDPKRGLASIEAIYIAYTILGKDNKHLLDHYYFKEDFLKINKELLDFHEKNKK